MTTKGKNLITHFKQIVSSPLIIHAFVLFSEFNPQIVCFIYWNKKGKGSGCCEYGKFEVFFPLLLFYNDDDIRIVVIFKCLFG
jgi:hypothetical protein